MVVGHSVSFELEAHLQPVSARSSVSSSLNCSFLIYLHCFRGVPVHFLSYVLSFLVQLIESPEYETHLLVCLTNMF